MADRVVVLDFDRTLFDTGGYYEALKVWLSERYGISKQVLTDDYDAYHIKGESGLHHYDFFGQLESLGLAADEVEAAARRELCSDKYLLPDAPAFLKFLEDQPVEVLILTYGEERFQRLKHGCVPSLSGFRLVAVLDDKSNYIAAELSGRQGIIIDDQKVEDLPAGFRHVWLQRDGAEPGSYTSLEAVQADWPKLIK